MPLAAYAAIFASAVLFLARSERAADLLAAGIVALLGVSIRNAWDLLLAMARRQSQNGGG